MHGLHQVVMDAHCPVVPVVGRVENRFLAHMVITGNSVSTCDTVPPYKRSFSCHYPLLRPPDDKLFHNVIPTLFEKYPGLVVQLNYFLNTPINALSLPTASHTNTGTL